MHVLSFLPLTELAVVERGSGSWHPNAVHARPFNVNLSCRVPFGRPPLRRVPPWEGWRTIYKIAHPSL